MSRSILPQEQPPSASSWRRRSWAVTLVVGLGLFELTRQAMLLTGNPRLLPTMVLLGTVAVPASAAAFLAGRRVPHDVTPVVAIVVALVGGCAAVLLAAVSEWAVMGSGRFGGEGRLPLLTVAAAEEGAKLLVTCVVLLVWLRATPLNGLVLGAAVGTGFAVLETLGYVFVDFVVSQEDLNSLDAELWWRSLFAPATHLAWAGLTGCALGHALHRAGRPRWWIVLPTACAAAVGLHAVWDAFPALGNHVVLAVVGLVLLVGAMRTSCSPDQARGRASCSRPAA